MIEWVWETLKVLGSMAGLATAGHVIRDKWFNHYPTAIILPRQLDPLCERRKPVLQVVKWSDRPIIISWPNKETGQSLLMMELTSVLANGSGRTQTPAKSRRQRLRMRPASSPNPGCPTSRRKTRNKRRLVRSGTMFACGVKRL
jgi:hypothetical protein